MHTIVTTTDSEFNRYWSELYANDPLQNPFYSSHSRACLNELESALNFVNHSFVVAASGRPVFACSLTSHIDEKGRTCLGYFGFEASTHINRLSMQALTNNFEAAAVALLQQHIGQLIEEIQPDLLEYLDPVSCGLISPVTQVLLERGAEPVIQTAKVIDLSQSQQVLERNVRRRRRGMIRWGQRNLAIDIASGERFDAAALSALAVIFKEALAIGTSPCSSLSFYEYLLRRNKAFLVLGTQGGVPAVSALFLHADCTCHFVFGSAVSQDSERAMLDAIVWEAIQHSKQLGCMRFEIGRLAKTESANSARAKFLNGFGADSQTCMRLRLVA